MVLATLKVEMSLVVRKSFFFFLIYFWLRWVFIAVRGLSLVAASGSYSSLRCAGFSLRWLLLLQSMGSRCADFSSCGLQAPEHRLSSCGSRAQLLHSMWDLPGPGLEPEYPALAGGPLTTLPPRKSLESLFKKYGASLVAQCLRICLPMQGTRVRALVWEDPTCCGAAGPVSHSY